MSNVISFPSGDEPEQDHNLLDRKNRFCKHSRTSIDADERVLSCRDCGAVVEPFDWILARLDDDDPYFKNRKLLRAEVADLRKSIEALKREEKNAKARVGRARKKAKGLEQEVWSAEAARRKIKEILGEDE